MVRHIDCYKKIVVELEKRIKKWYCLASCRVGQQTKHLLCPEVFINRSNSSLGCITKNPGKLAQAAPLFFPFPPFLSSCLSQTLSSSHNSWFYQQCMRSCFPIVPTNKVHYFNCFLRTFLSLIVSFLKFGDHTFIIILVIEMPFSAWFYFYNKYCFACFMDTM